MKLDRFIRISIGLIILLVFIIAIAALLFMTESALNVWDRLVQGPRIILYGYLAVMAVLVMTAVWLVIRLVVIERINDPVAPSPDLRRAVRENHVPSPETLRR